MDAASTLEFHIFLDPPSDERTVSFATHCRAALTAIAGRLQPRLQRQPWTREPFSIWLWDPDEPMSWHSSAGWAAGEKSKLQPHLWGRICIGDSVDDEWFIVGLLLQMSIEQRDTSIMVTDEDGHFLLIEAAHVIPRWLTPERASNRVFLRAGAVHIVPWARGRARMSSSTPSSSSSSLGLDDALLAMRTGSLGETRHEAATKAVYARIEPLMGADASARGPPKHTARCLLPLPVAKLLAAEPCLAAAAAVAFADRDGAAMRLAARLRHCSPREHSTVEAAVAFSRCTYAQLLAARFTPPQGAGFETPPATHPRHKPALLGGRLAIGMELLLLYKAQSAGGEKGSHDAAERCEESNNPKDDQSLDDARGEANHGTTIKDEAAPGWRDFEAALSARGYYRGEAAGSPLYAKLQAEAAATYALPAPHPPRTLWLHAQADRARALLFGADRPSIDGVRLPDAEGLPAEDSDAWLGLDEAMLNDHLEKRGAPEQHGSVAASEAAAASSEAAAVQAATQAQQLADVVRSVGDFMSGSGTVEGAEMPKAVDAPVDLNADRFLAALESALGGVASPQRKDRKDEYALDDSEGDSEGGSEDDSEEDEDEDEDEANDDEGADEDAGSSEEIQSLAEVMAAMDLELRKHQNGRSDFELEPVHGSATEPGADASAKGVDKGLPNQAAAGHAAGSAEKGDTCETAAGVDDDQDTDSLRPVDLDLNLVKNLLSSYSSQDGLAGPVSNLLGSMGLSLPDDQDKKRAAASS